MSFRRPSLPPGRRVNPSTDSCQQTRTDATPPCQSSGGDPMDIDSEPSATFSRRPISTGPAAISRPSRPTGALFTMLPDGSKMYSYIFEVDISNHAQELTDLEILEYAHNQMGFLERADLRDGAMRHIRDCRTRLRVTIDTKSIGRLDALGDCRMRMLVMQEMINAGMGWFPGLPWRANHFHVEVLYPRG
ncbi:hypothetical protein N7448_007304 [Penicillium atrosanguineum]|uniref:Uncharacterized protein n=1 Tax=Penicillium atrosanguineum TaxID=1132637 RepID=A0A9W9UDC5_9EURO|nr:uncharacterized protein N7443_001666 [Penicillium atrosanguineum]KAJ5126525.1 hypothetical protein N7448_007304 [Penicillium atrosanguineum]KAJ5146729.1 hypothetical protein N7526_000081 [Penicillium atrosanguineum]KAJ5314782.1 hypothetical protein N7443_001666 [Penicillium atrosanguineum]KAJ5331953.1 hypothetical protein N7476_001736 [Penicillium atrosanguineum]